MDLAVFPETTCQGLFYPVHRIFKNRHSKSRGLMAPGLLGRRLLLRHHLADFLTEHPLDFVLHCLGAGFAEMRPHKVGGLADFLHHRGLKSGLTA